MITDQLTNTLYFATPNTENETLGKHYEAIRDYLRNEGVQIRELEGNNNIWARNYMPVQVSEDKFVQFCYQPDYLDNDTYRHTITSAETIVKNCKKIGIPLTLSSIKVDGDNIIKCGNAVIMTDKVVKTNNYCREALIDELERLLSCKVYLIPADPYEKIYGHADSVLRYLGEKDGKIELLLADHPDENYIATVKAALGDGFTFQQLKITRGAKCRHKHIWAYINYIQTKDFLIIPGLSQKCDCVEDHSAMEQFKLLFPEYARKNCILQVDTLPLLINEGGLHCCSWNILK